MASNPKRARLFLSFFIGVIVLDQLTKFWALRALSEHQSAALIPNVLFLTLTYNTGIAFGLLQGLQWLTIPVSALVIGGAAVLYRMTTDRFSAACFGMLMGGAIANLYDRLAHGRVTDFLDLRWWPVFNIADSAITIAVCLLAIRSLFSPPKPHKAEQAAE